MGKTTSGFCIDKGNKNSRRLEREGEREGEGGGGTEWCQRQRELPGGQGRAGSRRSRLEGKAAGCLEWLRANQLGLKGWEAEGRSCLQSGGPKWACCTWAGMSWAAQEWLGDQVARQERTVPLLCSLTPCPQGSELLLSHLTMGKLRLQEAKKHAEASQQVRGQKQA